MRDCFDFRYVSIFPHLIFPPTHKHNHTQHTHTHTQQQATNKTTKRRKKDFPASAASVRVA